MLDQTCTAIGYSNISSMYPVDDRVTFWLGAFQVSGVAMHDASLPLMIRVLISATNMNPWDRRLRKVIGTLPDSTGEAGGEKIIVRAFAMTTLTG
ncbi:unnamed protein product [Aspergillus oryzae]|nr:unnamed protein product [Aspergillus oryzae]